MSKGTGKSSTTSQRPQARLCGNSHSSCRGISGPSVEAWPHHEFCLLCGRKDASLSQANWAARVSHDCNSSLIHPDLLLQSRSAAWVQPKCAVWITHSRLYEIQWLEDTLFTCSYRPQTKKWISYKSVILSNLKICYQLEKTQVLVIIAAW